MNRSTSRTRAPLPGWLIVVGSAAIVYHLAAIVVPILDAPSGPWPSQMGRSPGKAPAFAHEAAGLATLHGEYLRVVHSYHFMSNRPADLPGVKFEVRLRDATGKVVETLAFPRPGANPWVRRREEILASGLAPDVPMEAAGGEVLPAPGAQAPSDCHLGELDGCFPGAVVEAVHDDAAPARKVELHLHTVPQHLVPRNRPVMRPTEWAILLAKSYSRYLCRTQGAHSAEIIRITREPVPPDAMKAPPPPGAFDELLASFGEFSQ